MPCVWWNSEAYLSSLKLLSKLLLLPTYSNIDNKKNKISINKNNKNNNNNSNNNNGEHNGEYTEEVCLEMINALNSYVGSVVGGADSSMLTNNINLTLKFDLRHLHHSCNYNSIRYFVSMQLLFIFISLIFILQ